MTETTSRDSARGTHQQNLKRALDIAFSLGVLTGAGPVLLLFMYLIWRHDGHNPLYMAPRVGLRGEPFKMIKLRSMSPDADKTGVSSTSADDNRITPVGHIVRKYKLDEFSQFWNVLKGEMSVVGPRPQVPDCVADYNPEEMGLLDAKPGITDFSSIVFADEGDILEGSDDPDGDYDRLIRPWKSKLGLFYIENQSIYLDLSLIALTAFSMLSRKNALLVLSRLLKRLGAEKQLEKISKREKGLERFSQLP